MDESNTHTGVAAFVRAPLVHFLVLGGLIFGIYSLTRPGPSFDPKTPERLVVVSAERVAAIREGWQRKKQRLPTETELRGLIESVVREEILSREAVALGLDQEDPIVRRRLAQKMDFMARDLLTPADPSDEELTAFLSENADRYRRSVRVTFEHVYFSADRRGADVRADAAAALETLRKRPDADTGEIGDAVMLPPRAELAELRDVVRRFGDEFAQALPELPVAEWSGPVRSAYGFHLVRVSERRPAELPALEEVRAEVTRDFRVERRDTANQELYAKLREQYRVEVDEDAVRAALAGPPR